jgi:hypothetical protein
LKKFFYGKVFDKALFLIVNQPMAGWIYMMKYKIRFDFSGIGGYLQMCNACSIL